MLVVTPAATAARMPEACAFSASRYAPNGISRLSRIGEPLSSPNCRDSQRRYAGNLRFVFRHFPLSQAHPYAHMAAELAEAAAVEGQSRAMHDWLYENQDGWVANGGAGLEAGVQALGLDKAAIAAALRSPDIDTHIRRDFMGGVRSGVNGTPSFYVNGELHQGDFDSLTHGIGRLIARQA